MDKIGEKYNWKGTYFFGTFIYIDEQAPGKLLSHYQLSKIQAAKKIQKY